MSLVSLELARQHLRIDTDPDDDPESLLLPLYIATAEEAACDYLNRQVFANEADMAAAVEADTAGDRPMVVTASVQAAILLMLGHLYVNREDSVVGISVVELPNGSKALLQPRRIGMGA
jgi:hypothetical protein